eukprot:4578910-Prymnesium_polylepis.1
MSPMYAETPCAARTRWSGRGSGGCSESSWFEAVRAHEAERFVGVLVLLRRRAGRREDVALHGFGQRLNRLLAGFVEARSFRFH